MKNIRLFGAILAMALIVGFTSCTSNDDEHSEFVLTLNATQIPYGTDNGWTETYNAEAQLSSQNMWFSHGAIVGDGWKSWSGFVPSRVSTDPDLSISDYLEYQFEVMSQGGISGKGTPYLVGYWNSSESESVAIADASCSMSFGSATNKSLFKPQSMMVNNSVYTYYTMLNGNDYCKKFADGDWLVLKIYGIREGGEKIGPVEYYLADYRNGKSEIIKDWTFVSLDELGEVQYLLFQMDSSDKGKWGINTPTYFCMDRLKIQL